MQKVNIVVGRFQPFTTGHYSCVEAAMNKRGLPTVICMINVPEDKVDLRHPFPSDMLTDLYGNIVFNNNPNIAGVVPVRNADIVKIGETLRKLGFKIASWTCGTDRFENYLNQAESYHDLAGLSDDFEVIKVPRDLEKDTSATKVRSCLLNDDRKGFLSMVPASTNDGNILYDALKEQIDKVYGKVEKRYRKISKLTLEERVLRLEKLLNKLTLT